MPRPSITPVSWHAVTTSSTPRAWLLLATLFLAAFPPVARAADVDANGIDDVVEVQLAEKFKPAFILHAGRIAEPEPVEIMHNEPAAYLQPDDLFLKAYDVGGALNFSGPYCDWTNWLGCQENNRLHLTPSYASNGWINNGGTMEVWLAHFDYGGPGNENGTAWRNTYLYGNSYVQPADQYDPKVYAHFYTPGSDCYIQYWIFYPYNDFINNHEGDWEHISVRLTSTDPATAQISEILYFAHDDRFMPINGIYLSQAHFVDETHPVIFVGGYGSYSCAGETGEGHESGASFPSPGVFTGVGSYPCGDTVEQVSLGGKFLHPLEVDLEVLPDFPHPGTAEWTIDHHNWFMAHPETQWMMSNTKWGYPFADMPWLEWNNVPILALFAWFNGEDLYDLGQLAPRTPPYQPTWNSVYGGANPYYGFVDNLLGSPLISYVAMVADGELFANQQFSYNSVAHPNPSYILFADGVLEVPAIIQIGNDQYTFVGWEDGSSSPVRSVVASNQSESYTAQYALLGEHWTEVLHPNANSYWSWATTSLIAWKGCGLYCDGGDDGNCTWDSHEVFLSSDGGMTWGDPLITVAGNICHRYWTPPAVVSDQCRVRVRSHYTDPITQLPTYIDALSEIFSIGGAFVDEAPYFNNMSLDEPTSVVWIDYDNDGNLDLARSRFEEGIELYQGNGQVRNDWTEEGFQDVTAEAGLAAIDFSYALGMSWADFDNDGHTDFYVARAGGYPNRLMRNNGDGTFTEFMAPVVQGLSRGQSASFADYNLDGRADIFVANPSDPNRLYRNQGSWVDVSGSIAGEATDGSVMGVWGDYDNDGDPDLYVLNYAAPNRMYRRDATGFTDRISFSGDLHDTNVKSYGANWVDYDNDGDLDLYVLNHDADNWLYRNDGVVGEDVHFTWMANSPLALPEPCYSAVWSDFDLDGHQDVVVANGTSSEPAINRVFFSDGQGGFTEFVEHATGPVRSICIAAGDYQNDGQPDLYFGEKGYMAGASRLWGSYFATDEHWLRVQLKGTQSNKSALGARVYVTTPSMTQMREINAGSGYCSQSDLRANFGLGDYTTADVEVHWPSGEISSMTQWAVDKTIIVTEPGDGGGGPGNGCPFVFTWDGTSFVRDNSLLAPVRAATPSLAKAAAGRADANVIDQYVLQQPLVARNGSLQLQIREFEHEHSWIDELSLDALDHPDGTFVDIGADGEPVLLSRWIEPLEAYAHDGTDAVALVRARDGEAFSGRPGDTLDLVYELPAGADIIGGAFSTRPKNPVGPEKSASAQGVTVLALDPASGEHIELKTLRPREHFALEPVALPESVLGQAEDASSLRLQLRLVWNTAHELDFAGLPVPDDRAFARGPLTLLAAEHSTQGSVIELLDSADGGFAELVPGETITLHFADVTLADSRRSYLLRATGHYLKLEDDGDKPAPHAFELAGNVPNPFNPQTTISFVLPETAHVSLCVYAANGRLVRELVSASLGEGRHSYEWDGTDGSGRAASSGVYFYRLRTPFGERQEKMALIR